jgi:hypothetical protein
MSTPSLIVPRFEIGLMDKNGNISREWYKFFALMAKSIGPSLTNSSDLQSFENMDAASVESLGISALNIANAAKVAAAAAQAAANVAEADAQQGNIMAWWPWESP